MILSLDISVSNTGVCYGAPGCDHPTYFSTRIGKPNCDIGQMLMDYELWLSDLLLQVKPEIVVFESPILHNSRAQLIVLRKLYSLSANTEKVCLEAGVKCVEADNQKVKIFFTGKGGKKGDRIVIASQQMGFDPKDADQADAIAVWLYMVSRIDLRDGTSFAECWLPQQRLAV